MSLAVVEPAIAASELARTRNYVAFTFGKDWCAPKAFVRVQAATSDPVDVAASDFLRFFEQIRVAVSRLCPVATSIRVFVGGTIAAEASRDNKWALITPRLESPIDTPKFYWPLAILGKPNAPRRVTFVWVAGLPESYTKYRTIIVPFIERFMEQHKGAASLSLLQVTTHKTDLHGEGGFLLCANTAEDYRRFAIEYLLGRDLDEGALLIPGSDFHLTKSQLRIAQRLSIFSNPRMCIGNEQFRARLIGLLKVTSDFAANIDGAKNVKFPAILINGKLTEITTAEQLIDLVAKHR